MLYDSFRVMMMICASVGIIHMIGTDSYIYIFFPIIILIWGIYSLFDENDKEYLRRNGFFYEDDYFSTTNGNNHHHRTTTYQGYTGRGYSQSPTYHYSAYESKKYEHIAKKCNRNFKITIDKDG